MIAILSQYSLKHDRLSLIEFQYFRCMIISISAFFCYRKFKSLVIMLHNLG
jgi:hypothetical protein